MQSNSEAARIRYDILPYTKGKVLDVGSGPFRLYKHIVTVDDMSDWDGEFDFQKWKPDIIADGTSLQILGSAAFDTVMSSYFLNELEDPEKALREWWRLVKPDGYLVLYLPLTKQINEFEEVDDNGVDPDGLFGTMSEIGRWDLVVNERRILNDYSLLQVYQKKGSGWAESWQDVDDRKTCAIVRYGGIGDMIMMSSVLPQLKEEGYHITVYTGPEGKETIENNPNVDRLIAQEREQIPNEELGEYWAWLAERHDRFINFSEAVEGTWLATKGRANFNFWPIELRRKYMDTNYLEFHHELASLPYDPKPMFYPTRKERKWAINKKRKMKGGPVLLWTLSGSSLHKIWPYMDRTISYLLLQYPDIRIVLTGGELSRMGEVGWENEPRVIKTSGVWSVRESLSFAQVADIVIGPETGILNSVSHMPIPKLVFMSHSSHNNLTRDWVDALALTPVDCDCYPCHKMVYIWDHCVRNEETGVSECQTRIPFESVNWALDETIKQLSEERAA